jgi:hypothetical protein
MTPEQADLIRAALAGDAYAVRRCEALYGCVPGLTAIDSALTQEDAERDVERERNKSWRTAAHRKRTAKQHEGNTIRYVGRPHRKRPAEPAQE